MNDQAETLQADLALEGGTYPRAGKVDAGAPVLSPARVVCTECGHETLVEGVCTTCGVGLTPRSEDLDPTSRARAERPESKYQVGDRVRWVGVRDKVETIEDVRWEESAECWSYKLSWGWVREVALELVGPKPKFDVGDRVLVVYLTYTSGEPNRVHRNSWVSVSQYWSVQLDGPDGDWYPEDQLVAYDRESVPVQWAPGDRGTVGYTDRYNFIVLSVHQSGDCFVRWEEPWWDSAHETWVSKTQMRLATKREQPEITEFRVDYIVRVSLPLKMEQTTDVKEKAKSKAEDSDLRAAAAAQIADIITSPMNPALKVENVVDLRVNPTDCV